MDRLTALHAIVLGPDGRPAVGAVIYEVRVAGAFVRVESDPSDERGSLEVRGIPYLPDEPIGAFVGWEPPGAGRLASSNPVRRPFDLTSVVPTDPARGWSEVVRLSGPSSSGDDGDRAGWRGEDPPDVTFSEPDVDLVGDDSNDPKTPRGAIRVRVLGWDGKPVARPSLRCVGVGRVSCGADGLVTLDECTVGVHDVRFDAEGRLPTTARVVVAAGQSTDIVLREPVGARVDVSCVDVRGRPCSSAELEIETKHRGPILDVTDGVQRLDPFADERGRRTFARVSPDVIRVRARWGSRSGEAVFDVKDGETKDVRVVVK
jgi:hypothetical protein